jgi:hypothetical protein
LCPFLFFIYCAVFYDRIFVPALFNFLKKGTTMIRWPRGQAAAAKDHQMPFKSAALCAEFE